MSRFESPREHDFHRRLAAARGLGLACFSSPAHGTRRHLKAPLPEAAPAALGKAIEAVQTALPREEP